MVAVLAT